MEYSQKTNLNLQLYDTIILTYADPINSINLNSKKIIYGTMMGRFGYYNIDSKFLATLSEISDEQITGTSFSSDLKYFYISIGDKFIVKYTNNEEEKFCSFQCYEQEEIHNQKCESCFTLLDENKLLILFLNEFENEVPIEFYDCDFTLKIIQDNLIEEKNGIINLSNYIVPFDFKFNLFVYLEYLDKEKRQLTLFNVKNEKVENNFIINKNEGHISFVKLINENLILLVRNYNIIEIRNKNTFNVVNSFNYNNEINSIDFYFDDNQILNLLLLDNKDNLVEGYFNNNQEFIIALSINLSLKDDIDEIMRKKGLFNMDFPYYIKGNTKFIIVTCDYSILIFQKTI